MKENLAKTYSPLEIEAKWYPLWEEKGWFKPEVHPEGEPFCIVMPPPNVTGQLHMGHALDYTTQDILTRWRRMQGRRALWLPGTDHAGISTQAKVTESLAKEGLCKDDLGREAFLERTWEWKEKHHGRITHQLRQLGSSCDWSRERFTLDQGCSEAVNEVFVRLYEKGLIYRGSYLVNWCSKCQTNISDIEVEHKEQAGHLWHLRYPFADGSGFITVATSRPETILGDVAVAVHPDDQRYSGLIGKKLILPLVNREMELITDNYVDPAFGTGAVKITPGHDPNDFEVGLRHNLPQITVIGKNGTMTAAAGKYAGMTAAECRKRILEDFSILDLLAETEERPHNVGECYRCGTAVEPLISPQWFVKMAPLAGPAIEAAKSGDIKFIPERFAKVYLGWMENIRDWCISRQLWWGHRIPVWYCGDCGRVICQKAAPDSCPKCSSTKLEQDPDVLDTWFSSGLWPFSTLGWPGETTDLNDFYPTNVLVTARDIIFFWVARMIFSGLEFMGQKPFHHTFIHGLLLDAGGQKMSKSLGNGIDPIEIIDQVGADSLRFMLVTGSAPDSDIRFREERLEGARNFLNKLWNASRFTLMNLEDFSCGGEEEPELADIWIEERLRQAAASANAALEKYELGEAARALYEFVWDEFCDWYVELAKIRLYKGSPKQRYTAQSVLVRVLTGALQLLHPFIPFITEDLWQHLPHQGETIMLAEYPLGKGEPQLQAQGMELLKDIIRSARNLRAEMNVPPGKEAELVLMADPQFFPLFEQGQSYLNALCQAVCSWSEVYIPDQAVSAHVRGVDIFLPLKGLIDLEKEQARLEKEIKKAAGERQRLAAKLSNQGFLAKAPAEIVAKEREKEEEYGAKERALMERLAMLQGT
ncbi:MAG: valine--tRNA ligase [Clostridiales bacterium]|nr:valine--tRNA ligase [Clostridiales bacterium]